jgi:hypothetical protein
MLLSNTFNYILSTKWFCYEYKFYCTTIYTVDLKFCTSITANITIIADFPCLGGIVARFMLSMVFSNLNIFPNYSYLVIKELKHFICFGFRFQKSLQSYFIHL